MENKYFYSLEVSFSNIDSDNLELINNSAFKEYDCQGIEEFNLDEDAVDDILGKDALLGAEVSEEIIDKIEKAVGKKKFISLKYLFLIEKSAKDFEEHLKSINPSPVCNLKKMIYEDWNLEWKKHYRPIEISPRLKVIPEWERDGDLEGKILINPGMGFGTGTHETTYLCLKFLDELKTKPTFCLDLGCGSGILGIAAIKLYNCKVDFVDVSREALSNGHENLLLNFNEESLQGSSLIIRDRFIPEKKYDLIFANILENILLMERDLILKSLKSGGKLIISGLLKEQKDEFLEKFNSLKILNLLESRSKGDWCCLLLEAK